MTRKGRLESMEYQQKTTFCSNVEYSLYRDIKEYCKENRITLSSLIDRLFTKVLEEDKRIG